MILTHTDILLKGMRENLREMEEEEKDEIQNTENKA